MLDAVFRFPAPFLVAGDTRRFLKVLTQLFGLGLDEIRDHALLDDGVAPGPQPRTQEHVLDVPAAAAAVVQKVDGLPVPGDLAANGDFREGRVLACDPLIGVVKNQLNAGLGRGFPGIGAVEDDVRDGLAPELLGAAFPHHPAYRVNDVGFTAPIGPHNGREVDREVHRGGIHEGFKARQFYGF